MTIVLVRLLSFAQSMQSLRHLICNMASVFSTNTFTESYISNSPMKLNKLQKVAIEEFELDTLNRMFITGDLSVPEQQLFIQLVKGASLQSHYDLQQSVKYFEMEGLI